MGKHCAAYGCRNSSVKDEEKDKGISLHKFPKESTLRNKWAFAMNRKGFQPNNYSSVCSAYPPRLDPLNPRVTREQQNILLILSEPLFEDIPKLSFVILIR